MNRLSSEKSAYLKHSAYQKIDWYPWSEEAFERARREDKPVFLSSGAVWCHWCHVMAKECFENDEIIDLLNENFISVKIDRDERPEIDKRYQYVLHAMGSGGGWPLSMFLTPDKKPFFGGTYFPAEGRDGHPGFKEVLQTVSDFYKTKKDKVEESGRRLIEALKPLPLVKGGIEESLLNEGMTKILYSFDTSNGGFGNAPKFPTPGAVEFLINRYFFTGMESLKYTASKTLEAMASGGIRDQIGGGFHRYSTDAAWVMPHFEKLADDNAWHLMNYLHAFSIFGNTAFRETAEGIVRFAKEVLSDPAGGFYTSQDADVMPEDEGGYFTWTDEEFKSVLESGEYEILSLHLMNERGAMHHDTSKKVLFISMDASQIASKLGMDEQHVLEVIVNGKKKLAEIRNGRKSPLIDRTIYASTNGLMISAFLEASAILKDESLRVIAEKSLARVTGALLKGDHLFHSEGVEGLLDDYVHLAGAQLKAYELTGSASYLSVAELLMKSCIERFWDKEAGGFFDSQKAILGLRFKVIEDLPLPSPNSAAMLLLLRLHFITGNESYLRRATESLETFSRQAAEMGIHAGYYLCALDACFRMLKLTLKTPPGSPLAEACLSSSYPYTAFVYEEDEGRVVPCSRDACYEAQESREAIDRFFAARRGS